MNDKIKELGQLKISPTKKLLKLIKEENNSKIKDLLQLFANSKDVDSAGLAYKIYNEIPDERKANWGEMEAGGLLKHAFGWSDTIKDNRNFEDFFVLIYHDIRSEIMRDNTLDPNFSWDFIDNKFKKYKEELDKSIPENTVEWAAAYIKRDRERERGRL